MMMIIIIIITTIIITELGTICIKLTNCAINATLIVRIIAVSDIPLVASLIYNCLLFCMGVQLGLLH